jgi:hypothetical protein
MPAMSRRASRWTTLVVVAGVALLAGVLLAACGGPFGNADDEGGRFVGQWSFTGQNGKVAHITISRSGDGYLLDGSVPYVARDDRLVATQKGYPEFYVEDGKVMLTPPALGKAWGPVVMTRASSRGVEDENAVIFGVHKIQVGLASWAVDHDAIFPDRALVAADTEFAARYVQPWPVDPYTGQPMKQGSGPGDFAYTVNGSSFGLTGYGASGQALVSVP